MNMLNYTNGLGHLIVTLAFAAIGTALIIVPWTDAATKGVGISLLSMVAAAWFVPGAARQVAYQVQKKVEAPAVEELPPPTPLKGA